ncbi:hypothetical protein [Streptomyces sp. NPDC097610]|uniref:hypothetical protein n=1 Tax=Streptomyces sp. NPDC097610 TaxID=3157227 RepID=UPI003330A210
MPGERNFAANVWGNITRTGGVFSHNTVVGTGEGREELSRRLEELKQLLVTYEASLSDGPQLREMAEELRIQLSQPQPNRTVIRGLLAALAAGAGGISAVLVAVDGLAQVISTLID